MRGTPSRIARTLGLAALLAVPACSAEDDATEEAWRAALPEKPHVVLYLIDTLRADHLGTYGYEGETSPNIDALALESAVFESAFAQGPWTVPSVASLMTSTYTSVHGMVTLSQKVPESVTTLAEMMEGAGYQTAGFIQSPFSGSVTGLGQGYSELIERPQGKLNETQKTQGLRTLRPFHEWLESRSSTGVDGESKPAFMYLHTVEPHYPITGSDERFFPPAEQKRLRRLNKLLDRFRELSRYREKRMKKDGGKRHAAQVAEIKKTLAKRQPEILKFYDRAVRMADANLAAVIAQLKEKGMWENTVFIVIADHGEELLDHGYWLHDQSLYDELVRVPLVMRIPGVTDAGRRIPAPVQLIDLAPTLADLVGGTVDADWQGRSVLPLAVGAGNTLGDAPAFTERRNLRKFDSELKALRGDSETAVIDGQWKLVEHHDVSRVSLFDRSTDPGEMRDISATSPERTRELRAKIAALKDAADAAKTERATETELSPATQDQLRELGYIN